MSLPDGFHWDKRLVLRTYLDSLYLDQMLIAMVSQRLDGGWLVRVDAHLDGPDDMRRCANYEVAVAHVEAWARRHRVRLRDEVAKVVARLPAHNGAHGLNGR